MDGLYKKIISLIFLSLVLSVCHATQGSIYNTRNLRDIDGTSINMADYKGKWIIINYWADWCGPCASEIPQLNAFYQQHQNKDAVLFAINYDHLAAAQLKAIIETMKIEYPSIIGNVNLGDITVVPMTFIFSPDGKLTYKLLGQQTKESLERKMDLR